MLPAWTLGLLPGEPAVHSVKQIITFQNLGTRMQKVAKEAE